MIHIEFEIERGQSITKCPYAEIANKNDVFVGSYACYNCIFFIDRDDTSVECMADDLIEESDE